MVYDNFIIEIKGIGCHVITTDLLKVVLLINKMVLKVAFCKGIVLKIVVILLLIVY